MRILLFILFAGSAATVYAQVGLDYFLPPATRYDSTIPTPREALGFELGAWHASHDQLVGYMTLLAAKSPRIRILEYARSYENRPLLLLAITSESNQDQLEDLRQRHTLLTDPGRSEELDLTDMPVVVWLGYSVHGNEASGSNASMAVVYHLAAAVGPTIESWLDSMIILVDPSINPDGFNRFASWVNVHRSKHPDPRPASREHNESWPGGRTNHYWFDLNRDWLPVQHPESKGRVNQFHRWKPNILTDHHEMRSDDTFFFQPGVPARNHPLTPNTTFALTREIARYHARRLDEIGSLYYTKEQFDDYYIGKGSTYPDLNGSIGILFEQASPRGHLRETNNGLLSFPFAIKNHFTTSLSTLEAAFDLRTDLLEHQRSFYLTSKSVRSEYNAYIFGSETSIAESREFIRILDQHQIQVYRLGRTFSLNGHSFDSSSGFIVPTTQSQSRLIQAIFETRRDFVDSLFYDISAWTLPLSLDLQWLPLTAQQYSSGLVGERVMGDEISVESTELIQSKYAYAMPWADYYAPKVLYRLQKNGLRVKAATDPFTTNDGRSYGRGSLLLPVENQSLNPGEIHQLLERTVAGKGTQVYGVLSGLSSVGVDMGSPKFRSLVQPKVALLVGPGVSGYEAGEVWHLLDWRFDIDLTLLPMDQLSKVDWNDFNTLVMVDGNYSELSGSLVQLRNWIESGGSVLAFKRAAKWLSDNELSKVKFKVDAADSTLQRQYSDMDRYRGANVIGGAIFLTWVDRSHPVGYGYQDDQLPVFVNSNNFFSLPTNPYSYPVIFGSEPLLSGYVSSRNLAELAGSPGLIISNYGRGKIISFSFNPNFRAFWYGTNRLFLNSLFFSHIIDSKSAD